MMFSMKKRGTEWLFYLLVLYVFFAAIWWSYLLYIKNNDALEAKKSVLWHRFQAEGRGDEGAYFLSSEYVELVREYEKQQWMILGEGLMLLLFILAGIFQIYRARQKERGLNQQQENFLLSITHELKSPIASVRLILETFQRRVLQAEQRERLAVNALKETDRLHRLVQDLLLAARMDGDFGYAFECLDFGALCMGQLDLARLRYPAHEFRFEDDGVGEYVLERGDRDMLQTLVSNLLDNAVKYGGGTEVVLLLRAFGGGLRLELRDGGGGIVKAERERVFEKFYRSGDERVRQTKGTGLGLFIVRKIALAHGGRVWIEAADLSGKGTCVVVELPLRGG